MPQRERWTDGRVEQIIGVLLRVGVLAAAAVVLAGAIVYLLRWGMQHADYAAFHGEPKDFRSVAGVAAGARTGHGRNIIQLGLLLLIATPVARVAFALVAFALEGDRKYILITSIVLGVLVYSLAVG